MLAESLGIWVVDQLSGVDLQKLDATQAAILHRPTSATLKKGTLDDALAQLQIRSDLKATTSLPVTFFTAKSLTLQALLQTITRSQGLDFYMSGETVIIDTAAHVRALLEK